MTAENSNNYDINEREEERTLIRKRRQEIRSFCCKLDNGGAHIDDDGRLVARRSARSPLPPLPHDARDVHVNVNNVPNADNNNNAEHDADFGGRGFGGGLDDALEQERRRMEIEEAEAAASIRKVVEQYRSRNIPEHEFFLVSVSSRRSFASLPVRRILIAISAAVAAFVCVIVQTMPIWGSTELRSDSNAIIYKLIDVEEFDERIKKCSLLRRTTSPRELCTSPSDGVLHIPSTEGFNTFFTRAEDMTELRRLAPFLYGVNMSWTLPCKLWQGPQSPTCCLQSCFRGVHDGFVEEADVTAILKLGAVLIQSGFTHDEIHYNMTALSVPATLQRARALLIDRYNVSTLKPIAFRIKADLPSNAANLLPRSPSRNIFNRSKYHDDLEATRRVNDEALFVSSRNIVRDTCNLMSDSEGDLHFDVLTTIFLVQGGGSDYIGGGLLFADKLDRLTGKVRRGLMIDGSPGRIVVNSGGTENLRCRLPVDAGIEARLQIWWKAGPDHFC